MQKSSVDEKLALPLCVEAGFCQIQSQMLKLMPGLE